ncbi:MAG: PAS domain S-box protein, partial [Humidesulfovibrio sp.]|nr:PAS domain S-box protein [Humidesulfovibrio sp.]
SALGYARPEDLLGKNMHGLIHHTHANGTAFDVQDCRIFQAFQQGQGTYVDGEVLWRADGSSFPAEYWSYPQLRDGQVVGAVVTFQDITERRRAEADSAKLAGLVNAASQVSIIATDTEGLITVFNHGAENMLGYSADEMVGLRSPEAIHLRQEMLEQGQRLTQRLGRPVEGFDVFVALAREGGHDVRQWTYVHKDGRHIPVELVITGIRDRDGGLVGFLGIGVDISARVQAENALLESKSWLAAVLETAVDPIFTIGQQGHIRTANSAACKTFGYTLEELVGQNVKMLMPEPYHSNHDGYLERYLRTSEPHILGKGGREVPGQRKDGTIIPLDLSVSEISSSKERTFTGILRDISEQVRSRDALTAANAGLVERQSRLDADMEAAAEIQRSLLPKEGTCSLGMEADFRFMPSATIGGDIFNVVCLGTHHTGLYMIDVSGHGVPAALVSVTLAQEMSPSGELLMDKFLDQPRSPEGVLRRLDTAFPLERFDKFFSMFYLLYEMESGTLTYCNAGHPPPMLLRAGGGLELLEEGGTLVGMGMGDTYVQGKVEVGHGDMLLVYTDGVSELESPNSEQFGTECLEELFESTHGQPPEQVLQMLTGKLQAHADGRPPDDDISLVCVRFSRA